MKTNTRFYSRWRVDQDYRAQLTPAERAYLDKFNGEYYRGEFADDPLHNAQQRLAVYAAINAAARDVVTAAEGDVCEQLARIQTAKHPALEGRYYAPGDYSMFAGLEGVAAAADARAPAFIEQSNIIDISKARKLAKRPVSRR